MVRGEEGRGATPPMKPATVPGGPGHADGTLKVVLLSDTHYRLDPDRAVPPYDVDTYNKMCDKAIAASLLTKPDQVHWLGDIIDYNPAEWGLVKSVIRDIKEVSPGLEIYGIMGNHEYIYYRHSYFSNASFPSDMDDEVALTLASDAFVNMSAVTVAGDASSVVVGHKMAVVSRTAETGFPYDFDLVTARAVDGDTVKFTPPLVHDYSAGDFVRQGWSNKRAIGYFRDAFAETETYGLTTPANANFYTRMGNMLFIFVSLNNFHPVSQDGWMRLGADEMEWLEGLVEDNYEKCNIIVYTHEPPGSASDIGYPRVYNNWGRDSVGRFKELCRNFGIPLWVSGHTHFSWRDTPGIYRPPDYGDTVIITGPAALSLGQDQAHGEFLTLELQDNGTSLTLESYFVDLAAGGTSQAPSWSETISLPYPIDLSYGASSGGF